MMGCRKGRNAKKVLVSTEGSPARVSRPASGAICPSLTRIPGCSARSGPKVMIFTVVSLSAAHRDASRDLLGDHDDRNMCVASRYGRHKRRIRDAQSIDLIDAAGGGADGPGIITRPHTTRATYMSGTGH